MGRVSISPAQARAIAVWTRSGGDYEWITIDTAPSGTVLVKRGPTACAFIRADGSFELVEPARDPGPVEERDEPPKDRFCFVRRGARVRIWITARSAMEVAATGANTRHRQLGDQLLDAMENADELIPFRAIVVIPAPRDQADDPMAPVCLAIPDLDDSGELVVVAQEEIEQPVVGPGAVRRQ